jgi:hypothetical protein
MEPYFHFTPDRWLMLPTIMVGHPKCECCGEGPVMLTVDFLCFSAGILINAPNHPPQ